MGIDHRDHVWSNPETKAVAYYLFEFREDVIPFDRKEWLRNLIWENPDKEIEEIARIALYQEMGEPGYPDPHVAQAAQNLQQAFREHSLGLTFWPGSSNPVKHIVLEREEEIGPREVLPGEDMELLIELFELSLGRVNWEEIVTVWLEELAEDEGPNGEGE